MNETLLNFRKELQNLGYSKGVINNYPKYVRKLIIFSKETPEKITTQQIKNYQEYLQTKPNERRTGIISESYIYSNLLAIKIYFDYLLKNKIILANPYQIKLKQPTKNQRKIFTQEQIKTLYKTCKNLLETNILHLCYACGLRRTEVILLQKKDINLEEKLLFIRQGKGKKRRVIPLTKIIVKDLENYLKSTENSNKTDEFLGQNYTGNKIYKIFKELLERTENIHKNDYCLHSLRHSIASHLLENQMNIEMVRDFLGHENLKTTQIYTRVNLMKNEK